MLERMGAEALPEIEGYLRSCYPENIFLLSDLQRVRAGSLPGADTLSLIGYRDDETVVAAQGFYRYGRWFPHFLHEDALETMLQDALRREVRWIMGVRRVVDPFVAEMSGAGFQLDHDEHDYLCYVDGEALRVHEAEGVRPATSSDIEAIAELRLRFEHEYFGVSTSRINREWCVRIATRYIEQGVHVAERDGRVVCMAAVEAAIDEIAQLGAVYTEKDYRGRGLARAVVSALCERQLQRVPRVSLVVRTDNDSALRAYAALGFQPWHTYRMSRFV